MEQITYPSTSGTTDINACIWEPQGEPCGIVQISHGMAEYINRYEGFAEFLSSNGFVVAGNDHMGHGKSVNSQEEWGLLPLGKGKEILIDDTHELRRIVQERYGTELPYFLFGHSMGSFVVRAYLARYAQGIAGAIICGTGHIPPSTSKAGNKLIHVIARMKGENYRSTFVDGMGAGGYGKGIKDAKTPLDWLSYNEENVQAYIADPACGFMFSVGAYDAVTSLTAEVCDPSCVAKYPKNASVLLIAGVDDPVGDCGKGVKTTYELFCGAGLEDVSIKLYENMRHEILNETEHESVHADVLSWLSKRADVRA